MKKSLLSFLLLTCLFITFTPAASAEEIGRLKGAITWQYNQYIGTRGDVGAKIIVFSSDFNGSTIKNADSQILFMLGELPKNIQDKIEGLYYTKADGYGNYEIDGIEPGEYQVLILSEKTRRNPDKPIPDYEKQLLLPFLKTPEGIEKNINVKYNKHTLERVTIKANQSTSLNYDFGYTYF